MVFLWILAATFLALTLVSFLEGTNAIRVARFTTPLQFAVVWAFLVTVTALCRPGRRTRRPRAGEEHFSRRSRRTKPED